MKYLVFAIAVACTLPVMVFLLLDRRFIRWSIWELIVPLAVFNRVSINFFSHESYRGSSRGMEVSIIYIAALTLLLIFSIINGKRRLLPETGSKIYLGYFLLSLPSLINTPNMLYSFFEIWKMIMVYLVFLAVYYFLEFTDGDLDTILYGVAVMVAINFVVILLQHFILHKYQVYGVFPHQNSMAMFMAIAGLVFLARFLNVPDRRGAWLFFIAFLLASFAVVRSYSRGAIFCYPIGGTVTVLCSMRRKMMSFRKLRKLILICLLGATGLAIFMPRIIHRFQTAPEASGETRKYFAIAAFNMICDKPILGVGINNWGVCINPPYTYSTHRDFDKGFTDEHQDGIVETIYLLVAAECGLPCLIMLLCWFGYYWFSCIFLMKKLQVTNYYFLPAGALGALTSVYMQSALEWVLKQQINLIWLMTLFACISFLNKHSRELADKETTDPASPEAETPPLESKAQEAS